MRALDFAPLLRSSIGFENLNRLVDFATRLDGGDGSYPPYNIEKLGDDRYRVSLAVAGFSPDEIDITVQDNLLIIAGKAQPEAQDAPERTFLHRGIAKRGFERRFQIADTIRVLSAGYDQGMLNIELAREVPEHKKPRKIAIDATAPTAQRPVIDAEKIAAE